MGGRGAGTSARGVGVVGAIAERYRTRCRCRRAVAAIVLVGLILFGGGGVGGYKVHARFLNAGQLVKGNPVQVGGVPVGSVKGIKITDDGARRDRPLDRRGPRTPPARHARGDPPVLPVGARQPLRRPLAPARHATTRSRTAASSTPTRPSPRSTSTSSTTRSIPRRARRSRASSRARRTSGATVARRGQRRLPVPEPGAVHLAPALQRADQGHPGARALPRGQLADGHRARGAARRPRGPDREPQRHHARARQPEGGARRVDRAAPAVHAPRQHDVREPALHPRRGRPARRGLEAGGEAPAALPLAGSGLRRRRRADGARPQPHDPQAGRARTT